MKRGIIMSALVLALIASLLSGSVSCQDNPDACETTGDFLILNNQGYALCATADCFSFSQLGYCKCDLLKGNSISIPFNFEFNGQSQNICTVNQEGKDNGFTVSTFSFPDSVEFPDGNLALYTCPGKTNKNKFIELGHIARGTYGQCDGGLCFQSTEGKMFPGFNGQLAPDEIMCSCPFATICEKMSEDLDGYQISGSYNGQCDVDQCGLCNAGALSPADCELPNPLTQLGIQENIPVGAPSGTPEMLACILLGNNNVPDANSCVCQCRQVDEDGICTKWKVFDETPLTASCDQ